MADDPEPPQRRVAPVPEGGPEPPNVVEPEQRYVQIELQTATEAVRVAQQQALIDAQTLGISSNPNLWKISYGDASDPAPKKFWGLGGEYTYEDPLMYSSATSEAFAQYADIPSILSDQNKKLATAVIVAYRNLPMNDVLMKAIATMYDTATEFELRALRRYFLVYAGAIEKIMKNFKEYRSTKTKKNLVMNAEDNIVNAVINHPFLEDNCWHPVIAAQLLDTVVRNDWYNAQGITAANVVMGRTDKVLGQTGSVGETIWFHDDQYKMYIHAAARMYRRVLEITPDYVSALYRTYLPPTFTGMITYPTNIDVDVQRFSFPYDPAMRLYYVLEQVGTKDGLNRTVAMCHKVIHDINQLEFSRDGIDNLFAKLPPVQVLTACSALLRPGSMEVLMNYITSAYMCNAFVYTDVMSRPLITTTADAFMVLCAAAFEAVLDPVSYTSFNAKNIQYLIGCCYKTLNPIEAHQYCQNIGWTVNNPQIVGWRDDDNYARDPPTYLNQNLNQYPTLTWIRNVVVPLINPHRTNVDDLRATDLPYFGGALNPIASIQFYTSNTSTNLNPPLVATLDDRVAILRAQIQNVRMNSVERDAIITVFNYILQHIPHNSLIMCESVGRQMNALNRSGIWPMPPTHLGMMNCTSLKIRPEIGPVDRTVAAPRLVASREIFVMLGLFLSIKSAGSTASSECIKLPPVSPTYHLALHEYHINSMEQGTLNGLSTGLLKMIHIDGFFTTDPDAQDRINWQQAPNRYVTPARLNDFPAEARTFQTLEHLNPYEGNRTNPFQIGGSVCIKSLISSKVNKTLLLGLDELTGGAMGKLCEHVFTPTSDHSWGISQIYRDDHLGNISDRSRNIYPLNTMMSNMIASARYFGASRNQIEDSVSSGVIVTVHVPPIADPLLTCTVPQRFPYPEYMNNGQVQWQGNPWPANPAKLVALTPTIKVDLTRFDPAQNWDGYLVLSYGRETLENVINAQNSVLTLGYYYYDAAQGQNFDNLANWVRFDPANDYWRIISVMPSDLLTTQAYHPMIQLLEMYGSKEDLPGQVSLLSTGTFYEYVLRPSGAIVTVEEQLSSFFKQPFFHICDTPNFSLNDVDLKDIQIGVKPTWAVIPYAPGEVMDNIYCKRWSVRDVQVALPGGQVAYNNLNNSKIVPARASFNYVPGVTPFVVTGDGIKQRAGRVISPVTFLAKDLPVYVDYKEYLVYQEQVTD